MGRRPKEKVKPNNNKLLDTYIARYERSIALNERLGNKDKAYDSTVICEWLKELKGRREEDE